MSYEIKFVRERRLSLKIVAHRIRRYFPKFGYPLLLLIRYAFFPRYCSNNLISKITYSDGSWINRKTTADLEKITDFIVKYKSSNLSILQIGIGNSSLFSGVGIKAKRFVGISVVEDEILYAKKKFEEEFGSAYEVILMNKYSNEIGNLMGGFDFIIDNDISSYACCKFHFESMLDIYHNLLAQGGCIIVGVDGLGYFDSGFGLTKGMMASISRKHNLYFESGEEFHRLFKI